MVDESRREQHGAGAVRWEEEEWRGKMGTLSVNLKLLV